MRTVVLYKDINMYFKVLLFLIICNYSYGQRDKNFFRKDYKFLGSMQTFYKIHTFPRNWQDAKVMCEREGASLFYPEDDTEAEAVMKFLKEEIQFNYIYIGISALLAKGVFETIDGTPVMDVYHKWGKGEPNDLGGEDCVILRADGTLNDYSCDKKLPFVCSKPLVSVQWNVDCNIPDPDYVYNETLGRCYKFHLDPRNWTEAYAVCSAEQSYLAVIDSKAEAEFLIKMTAEAPKDSVVGDHLRGAIQLGFHNRFGEGWKTIKGVPLERSGYEWSYAQPDGGGKETCGSMFYTGGYNDLGCFHKCFFICEHDGDFANSILDERLGKIN